MTLVDDLDTNSIAVAVSGIDINNVATLDQPKRLATFVNHFLTTTVAGLNKFSVNCTKKLDEIHIKLDKIETQLAILERKLSSIPNPTTTPSTPTAAGSKTTELESPASTTE